MGNICRSPMAEGVVKEALRREGLQRDIEVDSAGTHAYHEGEPPDPRALAAAERRGMDIARQRARRVTREDFAAFDYILAMDKSNLNDLRERCPAEQQHKLRLFLSFSRRYPNLDVPDPYYGGQRGFEEGLDLLEDAVGGLMAELRTRV
jgi:protein-tyrosine phosphatase